MPENVNELFNKYVEAVGPIQESDEYFQYMFNVLQSNPATFKQYDQILHKVVDEEWLTTIEGALDSIYKVIDKPRKFIKSSEEVVPVALAKKITSESVRHLSQNTQFIESTDDNNVRPTKILNVTLEETYDLYENRFIYHLIQRLITFIDRRTDVIFWSSGDETKSIFGFESSFSDAYEDIEYKVEMKISNKQNLAENNQDNMDLFMRIDRVRRLTKALRVTPFCKIMAGCAKVHSPIQRTNLLIKDPDYRKCYQLWQFLERYDDAGFTIDEQTVALPYDEEYVIQLYTNFIANYSLFKSLAGVDKRNIEDAALAHKKRHLKPRFKREIKELLVDDYNIPDVEIRQVIVEEVTQAQLEAEAKLAAEIEAREALERELEDYKARYAELEERAEQLMTELEAAKAAEAAALQDKAMAEKAKAEAEALRAAAEQARDEAEARRAEAEDAARRAEEARAAMEKAKLEAEEARAAAEAERDKEMELRAKAEDERAQAVAEAEEAVARMKTAEEQAAEAAAVAAAAVEDKRVAIEKAEAEVAETKQWAENEVNTTREQAAAEIAEAKQKAENDIAEARQAAEDRVAAVKEKATAYVNETNAKAEALVKETKEQAAAEIAD
ncbi:MAG: DUF2357 domain-containing protein, partial [Firmicutes bacterium]|nr:DUF2357 domain-containing protein [Bacillota bacterium]